MNDKMGCDYDNNKLFCPRPYRIIIKGATGERGTTGATGATGASVEVRSTQTISPTQKARVSSSLKDNTIFLDFFIPQGNTGATENLFAGKVETVSPDESADVVDRFDADSHFFDFKIPRGATGERGITGEKGERGEKGDLGPQGIKGDTGPKGTTDNINATVFNSISQTLTDNNSLTLDEVMTNNGMELGEDYVKVPQAGTYIISFSINNSQFATSGDCVGVAINGEIVNGSRRPLTVSTNTSGTIVKALERNSHIQLVANLKGSRTLNASGGPSAVLTVVLIA